MLPKPQVELPLCLYIWHILRLFPKAGKSLGVQMGQSLSGL